MKFINKVNWQKTPDEDQKNLKSVWSTKLLIFNCIYRKSVTKLQQTLDCLIHKYRDQKSKKKKKGIEKKITNI